MCPRSRRTWLSGDRAVAVWIPPDSLAGRRVCGGRGRHVGRPARCVAHSRLPVIAVSAGAAPAVQLALRHPPACRTWCCWFQAPAACIRAGPVLLHASRWRRCVFELTMWLLMRLAPRFTYRLVGIPSSLIPSLTLEQRARLDEVVDSILPAVPRRLGLLKEGQTQKPGREYALERIAAPT